MPKPKHETHYILVPTELGYWDDSDTHHSFFLVPKTQKEEDVLERFGEWLQEKHTSLKFWLLDCGNTPHATVFMEFLREEGYPEIEHEFCDDFEGVGKKLAEEEKATEEKIKTEEAERAQLKELKAKYE